MLQHGRVEMHVGLLYKQNCDQSRTTAAFLVAGVEIWKSAPYLPGTFFASLKFYLQYVR